MKRSEVNEIITEAKSFFAAWKFMLPEWAHWSTDNWKGVYNNCFEIIDNKLGWDITDFGSNDFYKKGLTLFTIRNGNWQKKDKIYCEKIMELYMAAADDSLLFEPVTVSVDGMLVKVNAGDPLILKPGQSISLTPRLYHRFFAEKGKGKVLIGEVSMVNDDNLDNRFYEKVGRFPEIEEDAAPVHLLVNDYSKYL
jgi:D-lyxose ketol-isomerase